MEWALQKKSADQQNFVDRIRVSLLILLCMSTMFRGLKPSITRFFSCGVRNDAPVPPEASCSAVRVLQLI
jgi:hypothetical protein